MKSSVRLVGLLFGNVPLAVRLRSPTSLVFDHHFDLGDYFYLPDVVDFENRCHSLDAFGFEDAFELDSLGADLRFRRLYRRWLVDRLGRSLG